MGRREAGKETSTEKVQGKRGREISNEAGKKSDRQVCYLAGRTGTVEILMGFLNLRVTNSLTDRPTDQRTQTLTHTLAHAVHAVHGTDCGWHYYLDFLRPTTCS